MINDPNYQLPKDAFIRLFDNPIPAGDPTRSEAPEWAQELDEVVVWAHMGDNGEVSVKVNGEDIGSGFDTIELTITTGLEVILTSFFDNPDMLPPNVPYINDVYVIGPDDTATVTMLRYGVIKIEGQFVDSSNTTADYIENEDSLIILSSGTLTLEEAT